MALVPYKGVGNSVLINVDEAVSAGDPVQLTTSGVKKTVNAGSIFGICATDAAITTNCVIWTKGVFTIPTANLASGLSKSQGVTLAADAAQKFSAGTTGEAACFLVVEKALTTAGGGTVLLLSNSAVTVP